MTLIAGAAAAQSAAVARERYGLPAVETAPRIDGNLSDPAWKQALHSDGFTRFASSAPVTQETEAWVCRDGKTLFVAFFCHDRQPERIQARETQRQGSAVLEDDHVLVLVDSQNTRRAASTFAVNARGTQYDQIEGGTADNFTWAGDWRAAARRVEGGWTCEIAIPFRLLRYPRGATSIGLLLNRRLARETNPLHWPTLPLAGQTDDTRVQFFPAFDGAPLPEKTPRPIFLPFVLATAGDGLSAREGLDIKYPFSTTLTALLTARPDFQTVENAVASVNFSYNEQQVGDRRPFFADSAEFLPRSDLFYSRRITEVDQGFKVAGRSGNTTVGVLGTHVQAARTGRSNLVANIKQGFGKLAPNRLSDFSEIGVSAIADNRNGRPENRVGRVYGAWTRQFRTGQFQVSGRQSRSWQNERRKGDEGLVEARWIPLRGKPGLRLSRATLDSDFVSDLGLLVNRNRRGWSAGFSQFNRFDRGPVEYYFVNFDVDRYQRQTGGFFFDNAVLAAYAQNRSGLGVNLYGSDGRRKQSAAAQAFHDQIARLALVWSKRSVFQAGGIGYAVGWQSGQRFRLMDLEQALLLTPLVTLTSSYSQQRLGAVTTHQTIATGTWRIDEFHTVSARLVSQNGTGNAANVGPTRGTNFYVGFSQRVRRGTDVFLILGDPNASNTRYQATLKLLRPY